MGIYADDGSWNVVFVDGTEVTGIYSPEGYFNVFDASAETDPVGYQHPCGAINIDTSETYTGRVTPTGALNANEGDGSDGAQRITIIE